MKQIKYLLLLVAILMANSTFAQSAAKAKECLDKATAIVSNQSGITARFTISSPSMGHTSGSISVKGSKPREVLISDEVSLDNLMATLRG